MRWRVYGYDEQQELKRFESCEQALDELKKTCSSIWSAHTCIPVTGDILALFGVPALLMKTPMKIHVGIAETNDSKLDYGWCRSLEVEEGIYRKWEVPEHLKLNIIAVVRRYLASRKLDGQGLRIYFLEDIPRGRQTASPIGVGARSAALAAALMAWTGDLDKEDVGSWNSIHTFGAVASQPQNEKFDQLFRLAWKIASANHNWTESGAEVFSALVDSELPCLFFTEARDWKDSETFGSSPLDVRSNYDVLDLTAYWGYKGEHFLPDAYDRPFQYGIVFSGYEQNPLGAIIHIRDKRDELCKERTTLAWPGAKTFPSGFGRFPDTTWVGRCQKTRTNLDSWNYTMLEATANSLRIAELIYSSIRTGKLNLAELSDEINADHARLDSLGMVGKVEDTRKWLLAGRERKIAAKISGKCGSSEDNGGGLFFISDVGIARAIREEMANAFSERPSAYRPRVDYISTDVEGFVNDGLICLALAESTQANAYSSVLQQDFYWVAHNSKKIRMGKGDVVTLVSKRNSFDIWIFEEEPEIIVGKMPLDVSPLEMDLLKFILWENGPGPLRHQDVKKWLWPEVKSLEGLRLNNIYHRLKLRLRPWLDKRVVIWRRGDSYKFERKSLNYCWIAVSDKGNR